MASSSESLKRKRDDGIPIFKLSELFMIAGRKQIEYNGRPHISLEYANYCIKYHVNKMSCEDGVIQYFIACKELIVSPREQEQFHGAYLILELYKRYKEPRIRNFMTSHSTGCDIYDYILRDLVRSGL